MIRSRINELFIQETFICIKPPALGGGNDDDHHPIETVPAPMAGGIEAYGVATGVLALIVMMS